MIKTKRRYKIEPITDRLAFQQPDYTDSIIRPLKPYLELDIRSGELDIGYRQNSDTAVPMDVWNGLALRFPLNNELDPVELTQAINNGEFDDILGKIQDLFEEVQDGTSYVGKFRHEDGKYKFLQLEAELEERLNDFAATNINGLWDAWEWMPYNDLAKHYGVTALTTDEELEKIAKQIEDDARADNTVLVYTWEYLVECRERLREEDDEWL